MSRNATSIDMADEAKVCECLSKVPDAWRSAEMSTLKKIILYELMQEINCLVEKHSQIILWGFLVL